MGGHGNMSMANLQISAATTAPWCHIPGVPRVPPAAKHLLRRERRAGAGCTSSSRDPRTSTASFWVKVGKFTRNMWV